MALTPLDEMRLREALAQAELAVGLTEPNPRVGCILGTADGRLLGHGHTQQAGGPHAEVMALRDANAKGFDPRGATAWVTLEPCSHHGRTPPCCDALIAAGIARVVVAMQDPFPAVAGSGLARLRAAGIDVLLARGPLAEAAREINIGFFSRVLRGRPWVRLKIACSLDGRTALPNGKSQWITGPEARADGHAWRRRASVVLTGIGTVLADNPRLDVRLVPTARQPQRAVLDSVLRIPSDSAVLGTPGTLVYTVSDDTRAIGSLTARGAEVLVVAATKSQVGLPAVLQDLSARHANEVHVEAGAALTGAWLASGFADELLVYVAPVLLGSGLGMAEIGSLTTLQQAPRYAIVASDLCGSDLRLRLRPAVANPDNWCPLPA